MPPDAKFEGTRKPAATPERQADASRPATQPSTPSFDFNKMLSDVEQAQRSYADTEIMKAESRQRGAQTNLKETTKDLKQTGVIAWMSGHQAALEKQWAAEEAYLTRATTEARNTRENLARSKEVSRELSQKVAEFKKAQQEIEKLQREGKETAEKAKQAERLIEEMKALHTKAMSTIDKPSRLDTSALQKALQDSNKSIDTAIARLDTAEAGLKTAHKVTIVAAATVGTVATAGAGAPVLVAALGGTAAGAGVGLLSNSVEATGHVLHGNKDLATAVKDAGRDTLADTGTAAVTAISTATGGALGQAAGKATGATGLLARVVGSKAADAMVTAGGIGATSEFLRVGGEKAFDGKTWENGVVSGVADVVASGTKAGLVAIPTSMLTAGALSKMGSGLKYDKVLVPALPKSMLGPGQVSVPLTMPAVHTGDLPRFFFEFASQATPLLTREIFTPKEPKAPVAPERSEEEREGRPGPQTKKKAKSEPENKKERSSEEESDPRKNSLPAPEIRTPRSAESNPVKQTPRTEPPLTARTVPQNPAQPNNTPQLPRNEHQPRANTPEAAPEKRNQRDTKPERERTLEKTDPALKTSTPGSSAPRNTPSAREAASLENLEFHAERAEKTTSAGEKQKTRGRQSGLVSESRSSREHGNRTPGTRRSERSRHGQKRVFTDGSLSEGGEETYETPQTMVAVEREPERKEPARNSSHRTEGESHRVHLESSRKLPESQTVRTEQQNTAVERVSQQRSALEILEVPIVFDREKMTQIVAGVRAAEAEILAQNRESILEAHVTEIAQSGRIAPVLEVSIKESEPLTEAVGPAQSLTFQVTQEILTASAATNQPHQEPLVTHNEQLLPSAQFEAVEVKATLQQPTVVQTATADTTQQNTIQSSSTVVSVSEPIVQVVEQHLDAALEKRDDIQLSQENALSGVVGAQFRTEEKILQTVPGSAEAAADEKLNKIIFQEILSSIATPSAPIDQDTAPVSAIEIKSAPLPFREPVEHHSEQQPISQKELVITPEVAASTIVASQLETIVAPIASPPEAAPAVEARSEIQSKPAPAESPEQPREAISAVETVRSVTPDHSTPFNDLIKEAERLRSRLTESIPFVAEIAQERVPERKEEEVGIVTEPPLAAKDDTHSHHKDLEGREPHANQQIRESTPTPSINEITQPLAQVSFSSVDDQGQIPLALYQKLFAPVADTQAFDSLIEAAREERREAPEGQPIPVETSTVLLKVAQEEKGSEKPDPETFKGPKNNERRERLQQDERTENDREQSRDLKDLKADVTEKAPRLTSAEIDRELPELFPLPKGLRERIAKQKEMAAALKIKNLRAEQLKQKVAKQNAQASELTRGRREIQLRSANALRIQPDFSRARVRPASKNIA